MRKQSWSAWLTFQRKNWPLLIVTLLSLSTAVVLIAKSSSSSVACSCDHTSNGDSVSGEVPLARESVPSRSESHGRSPNPLDFMKSKLVLLVSHELSLSGGPLLLMELAFLLRGAGVEVVWVTNQKPSEPDEIVYSLEPKMLDRGVQVFSAKSQKAIDTALAADLIVLNTAVAGKWLDAVLMDDVHCVLSKILWWIHEVPGHYFKLEYAKHLPSVAGAMIDSYTTTEYWKNRMHERLGIKMPKAYVVHLGNSKDLMEVRQLF